MANSVRIGSIIARLIGLLIFAFGTGLIYYALNYTSIYLLVTTLVVGIVLGLGGIFMLFTGKKDSVALVLEATLSGIWP